MSPTDLSMVWPDDFGWPQDIGVVAIVDGAALLDGRGRVDIDAIRRHVDARLQRWPRSRQRLVRPGPGLGSPYWEDSPAFDVREHVEVRELAARSGVSHVLAACERIRQHPLDPSRPRWECWILTGMDDDRLAVFIRMHHAMADGVAGVAALAAFFDPTPDRLAGTGSPWLPAPPPTRAQLLMDNLRRRLDGLRGFGRGLTRPGALLTRARQVVVSLRRILAQRGAPHLGFNQPIGDHRRMLLVRSQLEVVKAVGRRHDATVNDVLLAAVTGGLRSLLAHRGELPTRRLPKATVPVAGDTGTDGGNATVSSLVVPLPVSEADPQRCLELIAAETAGQKEHPLSYDEAGIFATPWLERAAARFAGHQRLVNLVVSNVPGPPAVLYLGAAPVLELVPVVPLVGNLSLAVGALSYAGQLGITVVADADACPEPDVFVAGLEESLHRLAKAVEPLAQTGDRASSHGVRTR